MNAVSIGAAMTGLGVLLGAFGAHGLRGKVEQDLLQIYETGTHYLILHAVGILLYGLWANSIPESSRPKCIPPKLFIAGTLLFAGSLYCITFTGIRMFGMITPLGGVCMIIGWVIFAKQAWKK